MTAGLAEACRKAVAPAHALGSAPTFAGALDVHKNDWCACGVHTERKFARHILVLAR